MSINSTPNNTSSSSFSDYQRTFNCVGGTASAGLALAFFSAGNYSEALGTAAIGAYQLQQCIYPANRPLEERDVKVLPNNGKK